MEVRCQNCHARLSVPSVGSLKEIQCPKCGAMMLLPKATAAPVTSALAEQSRKKHKTALRRVFDPIPQPVTYGAGILLALLLFSPFMWSLFFSDSAREKVFITDEPLSNTVARSNGETRVAVIISTNAPPRYNLTEYAGVRLDAPRTDLDYRYNLTLQNTRGMQPEIYEGTRVGDIERITLRFYAGQLKHFTVLMRPRPVSPESVRQDLTDQFGPPQQIEDISDRPTGPGLAGLSGLGGPRPEPEPVFPHRRELIWSDAQTRVVATIHYSATGNGQSMTMLEVEVAAVAWLRAHNPLLGSVSATTTNLLETPLIQTGSRIPESGRITP
jgi:ribosomal protein S27E